MEHWNTGAIGSEKNAPERGENVCNQQKPTKYLF